MEGKFFIVFIFIQVLFFIVIYQHFKYKESMKELRKVLTKINEKKG